MREETHRFLALKLDVTLDFDLNLDVPLDLALFLD